MKETRQFNFSPKFDVVKMDYATLQAQIDMSTNEIFLHIDCFNPSHWTKEIYLDMLDVLNETEKHIKKEFGVKKLFVMIGAEDRKLEKFEMLFGFSPDYFLTTESEKLLIMSKEI